LIEAGERAATAVMPQIQRWFPQPVEGGGASAVA
jgi:hypothetical protein